MNNLLNQIYPIKTEYPYWLKVAGSVVVGLLIIGTMLLYLIIFGN